MLSWYQKHIVPKLLNSEMGSAELEKIRREVLMPAKGTVLELGIGPGYNLSIYTDIDKLYALEPSLELIEIAKERASKVLFPVEFLHASAEDIPLPDNSVDTVVSTWTLCSVADLEKVLKEIVRVLKSDGIFVFVDHGASPDKYIHVAQSLTTVVTKHFTGNCHYDREIEKMIKEAGFQIKTMTHPPEKGSPLIYNFKGIAIGK